MDIMDTIKDQITANRVILYMKGSPNQPQCGFSARVVQALAAVGERFAYVDVLSKSRDSRQSSQIRELANLSAAVGRWRADRRLRHHHGDG